MNIDRSISFSDTNIHFVYNILHVDWKWNPFIENESDAIFIRYDTFENENTFQYN